MFDGIDAGADRSFGGFGSVWMGGRLSAQCVRLLDKGVQFSLRKLRNIDIVSGREHATASAA